MCCSPVLRMLVVACVVLAVAPVQTVRSQDASWDDKEEAPWDDNQEAPTLIPYPSSPYTSYATPEDEASDPPAVTASSGEAQAVSLVAEAAAPAVAPSPPAPKPAPKPYKGVFYDNDFSYLDAPGANSCYLGDSLKRNQLGRCMVLDIGGEYRMRHMSEDIFARRNDYLLHRTRVYGDLKVADNFRAYIEAIDAVSDFDDAAPRGIDENRFDALNMFGDLKLLDDCGSELWVRGGRQELLYGAQRLISPLDWSNTRRTFDGAKLFLRGANWDIDAFWTRPVGFGQHVGALDHNFDHPNQDQDFAGVYLSRKGMENTKAEFYYLLFSDSAVSFHHNTFGSRLQGNCDGWLWEFEGGYQFGEVGALDQSAGFFTTGGGHKLNNLPWDPVFWIYYDWASGDDPTNGTNGTFNQLFPLGHKYFGWMDIVGRQNITDWNFRLTMNPCKKVQWILWWHIFELENARDALYNAGGAPIRVDATGAAGDEVGQELDMIVKIAVCPRTNLVFGYSHFFSGSFIANTPGGEGGEDFFFGQLTQRF